MERYWYCGVLVKGAKTVYSYISDAGQLPPGAYVAVPFGEKNALRIGQVKTCAEYAAEDAPYPVGRTKHILRQAAAEEYETQPPLPAYYGGDDVQSDLDDVDFLIEIEEWEEVYEWACSYCDDRDGRLAGKAAECYALCAEHDIPQAALELGRLYETGKVVGQDIPKAYELYQTAAEAGLLEALRKCGDAFCCGRRLPADPEKAYRYFSLGALLHGDAGCLYKLGDLYRDGRGAARNETYAFLLYQRALRRCEENEKDAACTAQVQLRLGQCLLEGTGTYPHAEKAHELLSRALTGFYHRRKTDPSAPGQIRQAKELLARAQEQLDREIPAPQKPDALPGEGRQ